MTRLGWSATVTATMPLTHRLARAVVTAAVLAHGAHGPAAAQVGWQTVTNEAGRFSVTVPGPLTQTGPTTDAKGIVTTTFAVRHNGKAYVVALADGPIADWRVEMDAARDALIGGLKMTLASQHHFKSAQPVGHVEATEFTARSETTGNECKARVFWHKSRMYMLGVVHGTGVGSSLDTDKFLDSFRITS